jgi:hypothetical protein
VVSVPFDDANTNAVFLLLSGAGVIYDITENDNQQMPVEKPEVVPTEPILSRSRGFHIVCDWLYLRQTLCEQEVMYLHSQKQCFALRASAKR